MGRTVSVLERLPGSSWTATAWSRARLVATSAARDATNAEEFLSAAAAATGLRPEVLSGVEEGELSFSGATAHVPADLVGPGPVLVVDIGGGSTELVAGAVPAGTARLGSPSRHRRASRCRRCRWTSAACGSPSASCGTTRPGRASSSGPGRRSNADLDRARRHLPPLAPGGLLIGLAGTVSTLAALDKRLARYDRAAIHHAVLTRADVAGWLERLAGEDSSARLARPGMVEGRADVIVGGVLVLDAVMAAFDRHRAWCPKTTSSTGSSPASGDTGFQARQATR